MNPKLGENEKTSKHEDMAIKDMTSIQNAYQSFAKQNYTMHDNLKLAYGGHKTGNEATACRCGEDIRCQV